MTKMNFHGEHLNSSSLLISPCLPPPSLALPLKYLMETNTVLELEPLS